MNKTERHHRIPRGARRLTRYCELVSYLRQFTQGFYPFLWLVGRPGVGKTEAVQEATKGRQVMLARSGQLSPLRFYIECYEHRGEPIILDDVEHLLDDPLGRKLVSALGDTGNEKRLCWLSSSGRLGSTPETFVTASPLCIIANMAVTAPAIQSRALVLYFDPSNEEIHRAVASWFWEQEIHDWIGARLARLQPLDARAYLLAGNDKRGCRDWQSLFLEANAIDAVECLVQDLETDPSCPTAKDKERRFAEVLGSEGGSRATYYNVKRRLRKNGKLTAEPTVGRIPLPRAGKRPVPLTPSADGDVPPAPPAPDIPVRESFVRPVPGSANSTATHQPRMTADDTTGWERPADDEDDVA